jgi:hypothetical protein
MYSPQITPFQPSNIDATTKMLMGLQQKGQLQQYVAQHKNDPNLVALALYVSNMSKAKPAVQAEANQPKIVDQAIAQMAPQEMMPEDQGIGTLPAPNMQRMSEGGIVAFGGGGDVPGYFEGTLVGQGFRRDQMLPPPTSNRNAAIAGTMATISAQSSQDELARIEAQLQAMPPSPQRDYLENRKRLLLNSSAPPVAPKEPVAPAVPYDPTTATRRSMYPEKAAPAPLRREPTKAKQEAAPAAEQAGISALATKPEDLQRIYANMMPPAVDPNEPKIRAIGEMEQANAARDLAQRRQDIADLGTAFTEREGRLRERQTRVEKEEGKVPYAALMEAGLAMMSGTSPNAFVNIGAAGNVGMKSYKQGVDKISDAKEKLDDAFSRIEEARRSEKVLNAKELRELENNVRKTVTQTEKDVLAGAREAYGLANAQTAKMFEAYVANKRSEYEQGEQTKRSRYEQDQQNKRTAMTANAPTGLERILSNPTLFKNYMESQTGGANVRAESMLRKEYYDNPSLVKQYPTVEDYLAANGAGGQAGADPRYKVLGSQLAPKP